MYIIITTIVPSNVIAIIALLRIARQTCMLQSLKINQSTRIESTDAKSVKWQQCLHSVSWEVWRLVLVGVDSFFSLSFSLFEHNARSCLEVLSIITTADVSYCTFNSFSLSLLHWVCVFFFNSTMFKLYVSYSFTSVLTYSYPHAELIITDFHSYTPCYNRRSSYLFDEAFS